MFALYFADTHVSFQMPQADRYVLSLEKTGTIGLFPWENKVLHVHMSKLNCYNLMNIYSAS